MKETIGKEELCQISLTGLRSLVLLGLLIQAPRSIDDIRQEFIKYKIFEESNSNDILRIDINTLRSIGCEISRADHRTNNKYVLLEHPFKLKITSDEVGTVKRAFNRIKENADIKFLTLYDELFRKIAQFVADDNIKEQLLGVSPLNKYSSEILKELRAACDNKKTIKLLYKVPTSNQETEKEIITDRVILKNDKLYLYGMDKWSKEAVYLNVKRILKIISKSDSDDNIARVPVIVKFMLSDFGISGLEENERILSGNISQGFVIEGEYHNEFLATQRILSFGSACKVLEPEEFKGKIIDLLKKMKEIYNG